MSKLTLVTDTFEAEGQKAQVGTRVWFDWVERPDTRSFRFDDGTDSFTARKEKVRGTDGYWYAYRKVDGKLHKRYIGRTADLLLRRLIEVGGLLNAPSEAKEKLPKKVGNSEGGLNELGEARETIRELQKAAIAREADFDRCIEQKRKLQEELKELHNRVCNLQAENEALRSQSPTPGRDLPESATLLNQLKAKRKRSTATLADVEVILEMLPANEPREVTY